MKKIIVLMFSLVLVVSLGVCASATAPESFDPTLDIVTSSDGTTITVTMNDLPDNVAAELTIPCDGWDGATVKDAGNNEVTSTFANEAVTFAAVGGTYTITKETNNAGGDNNTGGGNNTGTGGTPGGNTNPGGANPGTGNGNTTSGDPNKTESSKTFDAGIALYGAMAVLAATGSAVVIGKKRKD